MSAPTSMPASSLHARWMRFYDRVGITTRLAIPSTLAIVIGVLGTQWWGMGQVREGKMADVQQSLMVNLAMLKDVLRPLGTTWRVDGDKLLLGETVINGNTELVDRVKSVTGGVATVFLGDTRVATNVQRPDGARGVGTKLAPGPAYDAAVRHGQTFQGINEILGQRHLTVYEPIRDAQGRQLGLLFVGYPLAPLEAGIAVIIRHAIMAGLVATLVLLVVRVILLRVTLKPLQHLAAAQRAVASGDTEAKVPFTSRADEVGNLAKALASMRDDLAASKQAAAAMDAERAAASEARRAGRLTMADDFERRVQGIADDVAGAAERLSGQAEAIVAAIGATETVTGTVRDSATQAAGSVQNVAAAAEELAASIGEISRQVAASAKVAEVAARESRRTDTQVEALNQAATRISDVVRLIGDIAGQTNLLALNATIEAARAGEAGKGFAVVAGEVKNLAGQTAKATEEIGSQIAAMQDATGGAVQAIRAIGARIEEISRLATTVASAVEQQGAATGEIARSVQHAAANTGEVSAAISQVGDSAAVAAQGGAAIRTDAGALSGQAEALRTAVRGLVRDLRAA